jgi:hypothetical protein
VKIAFIGLGNMGSLMSACLVKNGYEVWGYDQLPACVDKAAEAGVHKALSLQEAVKDARTVVLMLPQSKNTKEAMFGEGGIGADLKPGTVVIDMSTSSPTDTKQMCAALLEQGVHYLDAPVSGGVGKAKNAIRGADLVLFLEDGSQPQSEEEKNLYDSIKDKKHIVVQSKSDEAHYPRAEAELTVSSKTGENLEKLLTLILERSGAKMLGDTAVLTRERHVFAVRKAVEALTSAIDNFFAVSPDCTAVDLRTACRALASITGGDVTEEVADKIFSEFCVGK